jgi:hypothetical protein
MLYFILPPIIIIIGITLITVIISRKSGEIAKLKNEEQTIKPGLPLKKNLVNRFGNTLSSINLKLLERLIQWIKVLSLRFHNLSSRWIIYIKDRKAKKVKPEPILPQFSESPKVVREHNFKKREKKVRLNFIDEVREVKIEPPVAEEEIVEPMISRNIIRPDAMNEAKSKFEEILVERIASNPRDMEAYERLGEYYLEREAYEDARECFIQVTKLSPGHYKAKLKLRRLEKIIHG